MLAVFERVVVSVVNLAVALAAICIAAIALGAWTDWQPLPVVASIAAAITLLTFFYNARLQRRQSREQHTIKILFDTRLSPEFRDWLDRRKDYFPETEVVPHEVYLAYLRPKGTIDAEALRRRKCAEAIRSLLNYYEFIALGVKRRDLDEAMLRGSIRGIMCNLVGDCREIIDGERRRAVDQRGNSQLLANLVWLYRRWRIPSDPMLETARGRG